MHIVDTKKIWFCAVVLEMRGRCLWITRLKQNASTRKCVDVVFAMVAEGHEIKRVAIADMLRTEITKGNDKWDLDQLQVMELAIKLLEE